MTEDDRAYVEDLIRTARWLYADAVALLNEAARIAGGEARDAVPIVYLDGTHYTPPAHSEGVT